MDDEAGVIDRIIARMLRTPWLMRLPIPLYRASLGWMLGTRLVMIEHLGRSSGERRFVVVEDFRNDDLKVPRAQCCG